MLCLDIMSLFDTVLHAASMHDGLVYNLGIADGRPDTQAETTIVCLGCFLESVGDSRNLDT